jgi:hypothetical protein
LIECDAYIYTAALSTYDEKMYENDSENRLKDSIQLFEQLVNGTHLKDKPCFLIFTKKDLFQKKFNNYQMSSEFEDYTGRHYHDAMKFIESKFMEQVKGDSSLIKIFTINALDHQANEKILNQILGEVALLEVEEQSEEEIPQFTKIESKKKKFFWQK